MLQSPSYKEGFCSSRAGGQGLCPAFQVPATLQTQRRRGDWNGSVLLGKLPSNRHSPKKTIQPRTPKWLQWLWRPHK